MDLRALPGLIAGRAGLAFGVFAALLASPALAVISAACALAAGAASLAVVRSVRLAEDSASASASASAGPLDGPSHAPETDESDENDRGGETRQSSLIER